jgi:hypothetical protein
MGRVHCPVDWADEAASSTTLPGRPHKGRPFRLRPSRPSGPIPLENNGEIATAGSHWDVDLFTTGGSNLSNELMTGYISPVEQAYLSNTTVGALADLGYTVQDPSVGGSTLPVAYPWLPA